MRILLSFILGFTLACSALGQTPADVGINIFQASRITAVSPVLVDQEENVAIFSKEFDSNFSRGVLIQTQGESNLLIRYQRLNEFPKVAEKLKDDLYFIQGVSGESIYVEVISFTPETGFKFYGEIFEIDSVPNCGVPDKPEPPIDPDLPPPPEDIEIVDQAFYDNMKGSIRTIPENQKGLFSKVADNFEKTAIKVLSGEIDTNQDLWTELSKLNRETITPQNLRFWDSFGVALQLDINTRIKNNKIEDSAKGRAPYLLMVAKALREVNNE